MDSGEEQVGRQPLQQQTPAAEFGWVDVIEAFTAMRQEFRTGTKEGRQVTERLATVTRQIERFEQQVHESLERLADQPPDDGQLQREKLAQTLADIDHHVARSVDAVRAVVAKRKQENAPENVLSALIDRHWQAAGPLTRIVAGRWMRRLRSELQTQVAAGQPEDQTITSGLSMMADRVARLVSGAGVRRIDVRGQPFDGERMTAVEAVARDDVSPGHVAVQLTPAYRWHDKIIRYAEVHVAASPVPATPSASPLSPTDGT